MSGLKEGPTKLAGGQGFEPRYPVPKTGVLPLDDRAMFTTRPSNGRTRRPTQTNEKEYESENLFSYILRVRSEQELFFKIILTIRRSGNVLPLDNLAIIIGWDRVSYFL